MTTDDFPESIKVLATLLVEFCVDNDLQLLAKAKAKDSNDDNGDIALLMCLHGDSELIDSCQRMLRAFITCNLGSSKKE